MQGLRAGEIPESVPQGGAERTLAERGAGERVRRVRDPGQFGLLVLELPLEPGQERRAPPVAGVNAESTVIDGEISAAGPLASAETCDHGIPEIRVGESLQV